MNGHASRPARTPGSRIPLLRAWLGTTHRSAPIVTPGKACGPACTHAPARAGPGSDSTVRGPPSGPAGAAPSELRELPGLCAGSTVAADP